MSVLHFSTELLVIPAQVCWTLLQSKRTELIQKRTKYMKGKCGLWFEERGHWCCQMRITTVHFINYLIKVPAHLSLISKHAWNNIPQWTPQKPNWTQDSQHVWCVQQYTFPFTCQWMSKWHAAIPEKQWFIHLRNFLLIWTPNAHHSTLPLPTIHT